MGNENAHRLGAGLARLRIGHGLSRSQLARAANVAGSTVGRAEAGGGITQPTADAFAAVLGDDVYAVVRITDLWQPVRPDAVDMARPVFLARLERGWSRRHAARMLGVHEGVLRRLERGHEVRPASALKVAQGYGLDVFELVPDPTKEGDGEPVPT